MAALLCLLLLLGGLHEVEAHDQVLSESATHYLAATPNYKIRIQKSPYALAILVGEREVLLSQPRQGHLSGSLFIKNNTTYSLEMVRTCYSQGNFLFLNVTTRPASSGVEVSLQLMTDWVGVGWSLSDASATSRMQESFSLTTSGHWFGGNVTSAHNWPLEGGVVVFDPFLATSNQSTPVWFTSSGIGIFINTYQNMGVSINQQRDGLFSFNVKDTGSLSYQILVGRNILEAHRSFTRLIGKPAVVPPRDYFAEPIFNTWIEFTNQITQTDLLGYAKKIRESGFPCKVLDLDDGWAAHYGDHRFNPTKFPEPKKMVEEIHKLGFKLALWVVPFVEKEANNYPSARASGYLVKDKTGKLPCSVQWWNGQASLVDLSNPAAYQWFLGELRSLQREYGIDGLKLDAGDAEYFDPEFVSFGKITPNRYTDLYASLGQYFEINELRVSWLVQSLGLVQRLRDKNSNWSLDSGLGAIIPHGLAESMIGFPYFCPDMIGGGLDDDFKESKFTGMDREMFIRWTEASALLPMMQFSYAPWRLDPAATQICRQYAQLHQKLGDYIYQLAVACKDDGTPIVQPLFFRNPEDERCYLVRDEFMLGDRLLVAPVLSKGAVSREIYLPSGLWKDFWSGDIYQGRQTLQAFPAPLEKLPVFVSLMRDSSSPTK